MKSRKKWEIMGNYGKKDLSMGAILKEISK
jgi:hypothetical protein